MCVKGDAGCLRKEYGDRIDQLQAFGAAAAVATGKLGDLSSEVVKGRWKVTAVQDPKGGGRAGETNVAQSIEFADLPAIGSFVSAVPGKVCIPRDNCGTIAWTRDPVAKVESIDEGLGLRPTDPVYVGRYVSDKSPRLLLVPRINGEVWAIFDLCASNQMRCHSAIEVWTPVPSATPVSLR